MKTIGRSEIFCCTHADTGEYFKNMSALPRTTLRIVFVDSGPSLCNNTHRRRDSREIYEVFVVCYRTRSSSGVLLLLVASLLLSCYFPIFYGKQIIHVRVTIKSTTTTLLVPNIHTPPFTAMPFIQRRQFQTVPSHFIIQEFKYFFVLSFFMLF